MSAAGRFDSVRREIAYAYEHVAFFRAHMDRHGLVPEAIVAPSNMLRLPPTRKADFRRNFPAGVVARGHTLAEKYVMRFRSSGTGGDRLHSAIFAFDLARRQATCLELNRNFDPLWRPGLSLRTCRFAPPNCSAVDCATGVSSMAERTLADGTLVLPVSHDLLATPAHLVSQALDELECCAPHLLVADPTHLAFLVRHMSREGRVPRVPSDLRIICGYTLLTKVARRQIRNGFGSNVPVADMLGMSELGYVGFECDLGRQHLNNRDFYIEFVAADRHAEPGELAELVITTIGDGLAPRIRYATGDLYRLDPHPCACGSTLPTVRFEGRAVHAVRCRDGSLLTPRELDDVVGDAPWIDVYRLDQDVTGGLRLRYVANPLRTRHLEAALSERLGLALGEAPVSMLPSTYIPSERSGKFISCASAISAAQAS